MKVQKIWLFTVVLLLEFHRTGAMMENMPEIEGMPEATTPHLHINNETAWPASIFWSSNGKKINTVVNAYGSEILGPLADIESLEIATYGKIWGSVFKKHAISLKDLKRNNTQDGYVFIKSQYWGQSWAFTCTSTEMPATRTYYLPENPWDALPGVARAREMGRPIKAHHIINIDPEHVSKDMIVNAYKRIAARWASEKFFNDRVAFIISHIVYKAHLALQKELIEGPHHAEETVFNLDDPEFLP